MKKNPSWYVVACVFEGRTICGPFATREEAIEAARKAIRIVAVDLAIDVR